MLKILNKIIHCQKQKNSKKRETSSQNTILHKKGQIAIILIFIIAVAFVLFVSSMNMGKIAQTKSVMTIAATQSSAYMASEMAGYAQSLYKNILEQGGKLEGNGKKLTYKTLSTTAKTFFTIVVIVISAITCNWWGIKFAIALGLSMAGLGLEAFVVLPGEIAMWNKQMVNLEESTLFTEQGLITALQAVATDDVQVPDERDLNMDGKYTGNSQDEELISRFNKYEHKRLKLLQKSPTLDDPRIIAALINELREFLLEDPFGEGNTTAVWDPVLTPECIDNPTHPCCETDPPPEYAMCNECCVTPEALPECCDHPDGPSSPEWCGTAANPDCPLTWPQVYDPYTENDDGSFTSLWEKIGHDDINKAWHDDGGGPYEHDPENRFRREDATGILPQIWDIGLQTSLKKSVLYNPDSPYPDKCYWCDTEYSMCNFGESFFNLPNHCKPNIPYSGEVDPYVFDDSGCCATEHLDRAAFDSLSIADNKCFNEMGEGNLDVLSWKPGLDLFCSYELPYEQGCLDKHCEGVPSECDPIGCLDDGDPDNPCVANDKCCEDPGGCGEPPPNNPIPENASHWEEDSLDVIHEELGNFISFADAAINQEIEMLFSIEYDDDGRIVDMEGPHDWDAYKDWVNHMLDWIRYDGVPGNFDANGRLPQLAHKYLQGWEDSIDNWLNSDDYVGQSPDDVCFPSPASGGPSRVWLDNPGATPPNEGSIVHCLENKRLEHSAIGDSLVGCFLHCGEPGYCDSPPSPPLVDPPAQCERDPLSDYLLEVARRAYTARNKAEVFRVRRKYFVGGGGPAQPPGLIERLQDLKPAFTDARAKINQFINSDAVTNFQLADADITEPRGATVPYVVYGWKDKEREDGRRQNWHIVRVDTMVPERCQGKCGRVTVVPGETTSDYEIGHEPLFPWVKSYERDKWNKFWTLGDSFDMVEGCGTETEYANEWACFRGGMVKTRIVRWDEDTDGLLKFANEAPIGQFLTHHPKARETLGLPPPNTIENMITICDGDDDGAFMLSAIHENLPERNCWDEVRELLNRGIMQTSCAEYFFHGHMDYKAGRGFASKFVTCPDDAFDVGN